MADSRLHIGVDGRELIGEPTGVGRYLERVLREWAAEATFGHRVSVFLPSAPPARLQSLGSTIQWRVERSPYGGGTLWEQTRLPAAVAAARVDVFFAPGYTAPLRLPCPFVVAIYDVSFAAHPEWFSWREGLRRRWLTARAARRARSILTISEFSASEIVRYLQVERRHVRIAPPGAPDQKQSPGHFLSETSRESQASEPVVLYVGSLFNRRHIPELLEAFAILIRHQPAARLTLVGANRTMPRIDPRALAASIGVGHAVDWREYVDDVELDRLYASARAFAFLSDYEGFAMTPMEALAYGVPAVLLDTAVAREIYGDGALLVPLDSQRIAAALQALLSDAAQREATLAAGRRRMASLSWTQTASAVRHALEDAVR